MWRRLKSMWFALRDWRDRRALCTLRVGDCWLTFNPRHLIYVRVWYRYCAQLLQAELSRASRPLHVVLGDYPAPQRGLPLRRVGLQIEHTLALPGDPDSDGAPVSATACADGGFYLARVQNLQQLSTCDLVLDYSWINRVHLQRTGGFADYLQRMVVVSPLLHALVQPPRPRALPARTITLFSDPQRGRRQRFLSAARSAGVPIVNVKRCFEPAALARLYRRCAILVNLRQSDHFHTFEELRVLPALLSGVLVISEDAPLREHLPYARFIIWSSLEALPATIARVQQEYSQWHARIFGDPLLHEVLAQMALDNQAALAAAVRDWCAAS